MAEMLQANIDRKSLFVVGKLFWRKISGRMERPPPK